MNEAARLLRLLVPGALFLLLYGAWFLIDSKLCSRSLPDISVGAAALVGGAAIPIGFVAQMAAAEITWCPWLPRRPLRTIDNRGVAQLIPDIDENRLSLEQLVGIVDVRMHERYAQDSDPHALNRVRSLTNLYQGLGNGAAAALLAMVSIAVTLPVIKVLSENDVPDWQRWAFAGGFVLVCLALSWWLSVSHRRVITITEVMVRDILRPRKQP